MKTAEPLEARYNWCQGPAPGRDPAVEKHCPNGSRKLRRPDFMIIGTQGGKVLSLTHGPPLPPGNITGTHVCCRLGWPQGHSADGRIISM